MPKKNADIREAIRNANLYTWQVAEKMDVHENTLFRLMRKELPEEKKAQILSIIDELKSEYQVSK